MSQKTELKFPKLGGLQTSLKGGIKKSFRREGGFYVGPVSLWIIFLVIGPLVFVLYLSFLKGGPLGHIVHTFTLENYLAALEGGYRRILLRSLLFAFGANMICLLLGYPLAYWIVKYGNGRKVFLLLLIIVPSWTCLLIRLYALKTICGYTGLINTTLLNLGLISSPLDILYNQFAVMFGLFYAYLPFMLLPIYASLEGLDPSLLEAAGDLGATPFKRFFTVTLPLTKGGIFAGTILVFIPSLGEWLIPLLLGGGKQMMAGSLVEHLFTKTGNYPAGSGIAGTLVAAVLLIVYLCMKLGGEEIVERII